jgi:hypothetical protein
MSEQSLFNRLDAKVYALRKPTHGPDGRDKARVDELNLEINTAVAQQQISYFLFNRLRNLLQYGQDWNTERAES